MPPIPAAPRVSLDKPSQPQLAELDARLASLTSDDPATREAAARELLEVDAHWVPAIAFRLESVAERADKEAMKRLFLDARKAAREQPREDEADEKRDDKRARPDYLELLVTRKSAQNKAYSDLLAVVGMSRMLSQIGSVEAVRTLLTVYVRFGEFLRIHTQRELERLGDKALPALIEARRHPAEKIAQWARRQLDMLGRAVPSEAVRVTDLQVLADVLRAYGRNRDPDAVRIIVSFANSERAVVRDAARQAIGLMGEVSMWQLRDTYEAVVGKKPQRDWSWERTARELFGEFDRARNQAVLKSYDAGRLARAKGDLPAMRAAFDQVLTENPNFEPKAELIGGYLEFVKRYAQEKPDEARVALARAARLTDDPAEKARLESQLTLLRAEHSLHEGVADATLFERALELDSGNAQARSKLAELKAGKVVKENQRTRYVAAGSVLLAALAGIIALLRKPRPDVPEEKETAGRALVQREDPRPAPTQPTPAPTQPTQTQQSTANSTHGTPEAPTAAEPESMSSAPQSIASTPDSPTQAAPSTAPENPPVSGAPDDPDKTS
ncbi:MAG TPA: hypothetical protein VFQ61_13120 [Polyangiaceae bacterium]|nr:hypothetical protein [Polyangiaceae bacterium]